MTNPVAEIRVMRAKWGGQDYRPAYKDVYTFCPACDTVHPFTIEVYGGYTNRKNGEAMPVWNWDGDLQQPTFSPSMLCYNTVHLCPIDYVHHVVCDDSDKCGYKGHMILNDDGSTRKADDEPQPTKRLLGHYLPHAVDPAWGNCHSFLRNGQWEFLADSAHSLAGQTVPMVPLPDWYVKR